MKRAPLNALQQVKAAATGADVAPAAVEAIAPAASSSRAPSRVGKTNLTGYFDPTWKLSLRHVQIKKGGTISFQDLLEEALTDLFRKYNVPVPSGEHVNR